MGCYEYCLSRASQACPEGLRGLRGPHPHLVVIRDEDAGIQGGSKPERRVRFLVPLRYGVIYESWSRVNNTFKKRLTGADLGPDLGSSQ